MHSLRARRTIRYCQTYYSRTFLAAQPLRYRYSCSLRFPSYLAPPPCNGTSHLHSITRPMLTHACTPSQSVDASKIESLQRGKAGLSDAASIHGCSNSFHPVQYITFSRRVCAMEECGPGGLDGYIFKLMLYSATVRCVLPRQHQHVLCMACTASLNGTMCDAMSDVTCSLQAPGRSKMC